jgi:hypothetical protein
MYSLWQGFLLANMLAPVRVRPLTLEVCSKQRTFCYAYLAEGQQVLDVNERLEEGNAARSPTRSRSCSNATSKATCPSRRSAVLLFRPSVFLLYNQRPHASLPGLVQAVRALAVAAFGYMFRLSSTTTAASSSSATASSAPRASAPTTIAPVISSSMHTTPSAAPIRLVLGLLFLYNVDDLVWHSEVFYLDDRLIEPTIPAY